MPTYDYKPKHVYQVTRTWYVSSTDTAEAISKSNQILHKEVRARKMGKINRFDTKGVNPDGTTNDLHTT